MKKSGMRENDATAGSQHLALLVHLPCGRGRVSRDRPMLTRVTHTHAFSAHLGVVRLARGGAVGDGEACATAVLSNASSPHSYQCGES